MAEESKKRIEIAGAFEKHFRHFGFKKTTVDDVAADLGASKKTIYKYFCSKEDIFYFIISRKAKARRAMIEKKILHLPTAGAKMEAMIRINFEEFRKIHKKKIRSLDGGQSEIAAGAFRETFMSLVSDIIAEGVKHNEFEVCEHEMTVRYIQTLITDTIKSLLENEASQPEDVLICTVNKLLKKNAL